jgi:micrococcal nuclease
MPRFLPLRALTLALTAATFTLSSCATSEDLPPATSPTDATAETTTEIPPGASPATVNYVHDGDTLFLSTADDDNLKVRLTGIDTPEIGENAECYGEEATALLRSLLPEGAEVFTAADVEPFDQYGRALLYVFTTDGTFVNLEMVKQGAAEAVRIGENDAYWSELATEFDTARASGVGSWGRC